MFLNSRWEPMLLSLRGELPRDNLYFMTPSRAAGELREKTGQDFGLDADRWEAWLREHHRNHFRDMASSRLLGRS
jgi:hypothetical protein